MQGIISNGLGIFEIQAVQKNVARKRTDNH